MKGQQKRQQVGKKENNNKEITFNQSVSLVTASQILVALKPEIPADKVYNKKEKQGNDIQQLNANL